MNILRVTAGVILLSPLVFDAPTNGRMGPTRSAQSKLETPTEKTAVTEGQDHAIKVRVNEVIVPVTILDSKGEMILNLAQEKFHILDNGMEQTIEHFDLGGEPLAVALVL